MSPETRREADAAPQKDDWSVDPLGGGCWVFHWKPGSYSSPFLVTKVGVFCVDPINPRAAVAYREAVRAVTDRPVRWILYSHDHRNHIAGAAQLAPEAEILAYRKTRDKILYRGDADIALPTRPVDDGAVVAVGEHEVLVRYFGPNHSWTNLALLLPTGNGHRLLVFVDVVEPGLAPYRDLPDSDYRGLMRSLEAAERLEFNRVMGGHTAPGPRSWVTDTRRYLSDLQAATEELLAESPGLGTCPGESGLVAEERTRTAICAAAGARLREKYGGWRGFEAWAPLTASRILTFLTTGN